MNKVQTGDPIQIKAATWNSFIDAAEYVKNLQSDQRGGPLSNGNYSGVVLLKNGESTLFPRFSAMAITDVLIRPDVNEPEFTGKCPAFLGRKVTNAYEEYPYAVLLEPVDAGKIGRALLLGIVPAKVSILDPEHKFAEPMVGNASGAMQSAENGVARIIWKGGNSGNQWCLLQLGGAGSGGGDDKVVMCQVARGSLGAGYEVNVYAEGKDSEATGSGILYLAELALNSTLPAGSWIIGHRAMLKVTGGNES